VLKFKTPAMEAQFKSVHPDVRVLVHDLDEWLFESKMERLTVTDVWRTAEEQERIYTPYYLARGFSEKESRQLARERFSWHRVGSAVDFRHSVKPYSQEEQDRIFAWLKAQCPTEKWELLLHTVGHGLHFHVARRETYRPKKGVA
jgi:hypothetical protein